MNDEKRLKAVEWFKNRAKNCPMPATRRMYEIAIEALEEPCGWFSREETEAMRAMRS